MAKICYSHVKSEGNAVFENYGNLCNDIFKTF